MSHSFLIEGTSLPTVDVVGRIGPEEVGHHFVVPRRDDGHRQVSYVVQAFESFGRYASVRTKGSLIHHRDQGQPREHFLKEATTHLVSRHAREKNITYVEIQPQLFIEPRLDFLVEAVVLVDFSRFVVASQHIHTIRTRQFQGENQTHDLDASRSPVHVIT